MLGFKSRVRVGGGGKEGVDFIAINQLTSPPTLRLETFGNEGEGGGGRCSLHKQMVWEAPQMKIVSTGKGGDGET